MTAFRKYFDPFKQVGLSGKPIDFKSWFPRHMQGGLYKMQARLRAVDYIIEVHDARIALTGRNEQFYRRLYAIKPHCLLLNKCDLITHSQMMMLDDVIKRDHSYLGDVFFTSCVDERIPKGATSIDELLKVIANTLLHQPTRYNRDYRDEYAAMVIGIPNVGKSSVINAIRKSRLKKVRTGAKVGDAPGVTRKVQMRLKINENPLTYIFDTPGVLDPDVRDLETGIKLSLCHTVPATNVGIMIMADYLLFLMNKHNIFSYVSLFGLTEPLDDIYQVLLQVALTGGSKKSFRREDGVLVERPDFELSASVFVEAYRRGKLGKFPLEEYVL